MFAFSPAGGAVCDRKGRQEQEHQAAMDRQQDRARAARQDPGFMRWQPDHLGGRGPGLSLVFCGRGDETDLAGQSLEV